MFQEDCLLAVCGKSARTVVRGMLVKSATARLFGRRQTKEAETERQTNCFRSLLPTHIASQIVFKRYYFVASHEK